jgi:hypothetical protein
MALAARRERHHRAGRMAGGGYGDYRGRVSGLHGGFHHGYGRGDVWGHWGGYYGPRHLVYGDRRPVPGWSMSHPKFKSCVPRSRRKLKQSPHHDPAWARVVSVMVGTPANRTPRPSAIVG